LLWVGSWIRLIVHCTYLCADALFRRLVTHMKVYLEIVGENSSSHVGVLIGVNKG
jgi:hypothetical protein